MNESAAPQGDNLQAEIEALIAELACSDVVRCQQARQALVDIGRPAVPALMELLSQSKEALRWEAAKALGEIADPAATDLFINSLEDNDFDIRWLSAEGLSAIGQEALVPLLKALTRHADSPWFRNGAHHYLRLMARRGLYDQLKPVLVALDDAEAYLEVPTAAERVLDKFS